MLRIVLGVPHSFPLAYFTYGSPSFQVCCKLKDVGTGGFYDLWLNGICVDLSRLDDSCGRQNLLNK